MEITFDTDRFADCYGDRNLTNVLHYLKRHGCLVESHYPSVERVTCRTPSSAMRYCRYFASQGISPQGEAVFLKNPEIGIRYLQMVRRSEFVLPEVQVKFRKKFRSNARLAYLWAKAFNTRLSEEEEEVFRKDMVSAKDYAMRVIKGKFPEKVHQMIVLASFGDLNAYQKRAVSEYVKFSGG